MNYKAVFGNNWIKAENFVTENELWIKEITNKFKVSYPVAISVVFPELIRYSALRDKMEITMLKSLYVNLGDEYADFSVGQFQMKPSFAEHINEKVLKLADRKIKRMFKPKELYKDLRHFRSSIVSDLEDVKREVYYLIAFIMICDNEYSISEMNDEDKVKFLAAVYNCGLGRNKDFIRNMYEKKFFTASLINSEKYSYSDISLNWYRSYIQVSP